MEIYAGSERGATANTMPYVLPAAIMFFIVTP
jgi:hypothetical protein